MRTRSVDLLAPVRPSVRPSFSWSMTIRDAVMVSHSIHRRLLGLFFLFIHYPHATYQIMARLCTVRFLSAVRAVAARCKLPFALRPSLSRGNVLRVKEIEKKGERT